RDRALFARLLLLPFQLDFELVIVKVSLKLDFIGHADRLVLFPESDRAVAQLVCELRQLVSRLGPREICANLVLTHLWSSFGRIASRDKNEIPACVLAVHCGPATIRLRDWLNY